MTDGRLNRKAPLAAVVALAAAACAGAGTPPKTGGKTNEIGESPAAAESARSCKRKTKAAIPVPRAMDGGAVVLTDNGDRTLAVVADGDERAVHVVDIDTGSTLSTTPLDGEPSQLAVLSDGRVVVALRDRSKLEVLEPAGLEEPMASLCTVPTPTEPVALTLSPDGSAAYVVSGWAGAFSGYDTEELRPTVNIDVAAEPREVVVTADGQQAVVAHAVGGKASVIDLAERKVRTTSTTERMDHDVDQTREAIRKALGSRSGPLNEEEIAKVGKVLAEREKAVTEQQFNRRRTSCQSFALAKSTTADRVYLPQVLVDPGDTEGLPSGYGDDNSTTEVPNVAVLDPATGYVLEASLRVDRSIAFLRSDEPHEHCILPRSAAVDEKSGSLLVGCFGTDVVIAYDAMSPEPARVEKRRWRVAAGPSGITIDSAQDGDHRAIVWSQFDRTLNVIRLAGHEAELQSGSRDDAVRKIEIPSDPERQLSVEQLLGRSLFHSTNDTRIAADGRACASCHPDGRQDGLVWATPNGPRRTKLLAGGLVGTAPFAWDGDAHRLEDHVRDTFDRLRGAGGLRSVELRALVSYMKALPAPPAVAVDNPTRVARGKELFASKQAGCKTCHNGATHSDNKMHDVKSKTKSDREASFNTPSLRFLAGRAPYYHDGRYATLAELLKGTDGQMGHTQHLDDEQIKDLEAFLLTL